MCRNVTFVLATFLLCAVAAPVAAVDYVKVGAWNIENLGGRTPSQRPIAIAEHIVLSGVDVLCVEEIHVTNMAGGKRKSDALDTAFSLLNDAGADWTYELFPNRNPGDTSQLCGVA